LSFSRWAPYALRWLFLGVRSCDDFAFLKKLKRVGHL
jgi:hypothetical protein